MLTYADDSENRTQFQSGGQAKDLNNILDEKNPHVARLSFICVLSSWKPIEASLEFVSSSSSLFSFQFDPKIDYAELTRASVSECVVLVLRSSTKKNATLLYEKWKNETIDDHVKNDDYCFFNGTKNKK